MTIEPFRSLEPSSEGTNVADHGFIVLIDDDAPLLDVTGALLRSWGYSVLTAASTAAAVAGIQNGDRHPDLLICHDRLADTVIATETIDQLQKARPKTIPALIISADIFSGHLRTLHLSGHYLLHKPVTPATLRAVLEKILKRQK
jgi:two-component system, sensor histidine kinase